MRLGFVTGKGGVGKTRFSVLLSREWKNSVLAEMTSALRTEAEKLGLDLPPVYHFSRSDLAEDFLVSTLKIKAIARWLSKSQLFQTLLSLAPNLNELLLLRQWMALAKKKPVIVDAPSTGHFLATLDAIKTAQIIFDGGSLKQIADELDAFFKTVQVNVYIVSVPEKSALTEMNEISEGVKIRYPQIKLFRVLNRVHQPPMPSTEIPADLKQIAEDRVSLERERIKNLSFDYKLPEGAHSL